MGPEHQGRDVVMASSRLVDRMTQILGPEGVISERVQLCVYECDGLMNNSVIPVIVVLSEYVEYMQQIIRFCNA